MIRTRTLLLLAIVCSFGAWQSWRHRALEQPPGILVAGLPRQAEVKDLPPIRAGDYELSRRARYEIDARLLSRKRYRLDRGADLAPLDFAMGWGPMSDSAILDQLDLSQSARFYRMHWRTPPLEPRLLLSHAANMHLIPATRSVERKLDSMRAGQVIRLEGWLVDAVKANGWTWKTSLSRDDTGAGACELMWVEAASTLN